MENKNEAPNRKLIILAAFLDDSFLTFLNIIHEIINPPPVRRTKIPKIETARKRKNSGAILISLLGNYAELQVNLK